MAEFQSNDPDGYDDDDDWDDGRVRPDLEYSTDCNICHKQKEDEIRQLNCGHQFHPSCMSREFARSNTCPICTQVKQVRAGAYGGVPQVAQVPLICQVCQKVLTEGTDLKQLACNHKYHLKCIIQYVTKYSNNCPVCRQTALTPDEMQKYVFNMARAIIDRKGLGKPAHVGTGAIQVKAKMKAIPSAQATTQARMILTQSNGQGYPPSASGYPPSASGYPPSASGYPPSASGSSFGSGLGGPQPAQNQGICDMCNDPGPDFTLDCGHSFHNDCMTSWFIKLGECPVCYEKRHGRMNEQD